jgi:hypothetical protein
MFGSIVAVIIIRTSRKTLRELGDRIGSDRSFMYGTPYNYIYISADADADADAVVRGKITKTKSYHTGRFIYI